MSKQPKSPYVLGRTLFAKIIAIEGIILTPEIEREFEEFDRLKLSPKERREWITEKYGRREFRT